MLEVIIGLLISIAIICFVIIMISWTIHVSMIKDERSPYDWCTFKTFIKEFNKYKDHPQLEIDSRFWSINGASIFLYEGVCEHIVFLHADIIKFNENCMLLYPWSWARYCFWKRDFTKVIKEKYRQKGLWK